MIKYAKLITETQIEFAPKNKGGIINYDLNIPLLIKDGYKEFVPAEKEIGKSYNISYKETATKIKEIAVEIPQPTPEELLQQAKQNKIQEASDKANDYIQSGNALYEFDLGKHIEATDGNIGKFSAYALGFVTGKFEPDYTVIWNTKEDETVELTRQQITDILIGLGEVQKFVWIDKFPYFLDLIDKAQTIEEVNNINIRYEVLK